MSLNKREKSPASKFTKLGAHQQASPQDLPQGYISPLTPTCSLLMQLDQLEEIKQALDLEEAFVSMVNQELIKSKIEWFLDKKLAKIDKHAQELAKVSKRQVKKEYVIEPSQQSTQQLVAAPLPPKSQTKSPKAEKERKAPAAKKETSKTPKKSKAKVVPVEKQSTEKVEEQSATRSKPGQKSKSLSRKRVNHVKKQIQNEVDADSDPLPDQTAAVLGQEPSESVKQSEQAKNTSFKASSQLKNQNSKIASKKAKNFMELEKMGKQTIQSAIKKVENPENEGMNEIAATPKDTKEKESSKKTTGKRARKVDEYFEQKFRKMSIENEDEEDEKVDEQMEQESTRKENQHIGQARQKIDQEGNSLKIEKKLIQKKQFADASASPFSVFQSKKKLKDKSQQLLNEAIGKGPQVIKYEDSRTVIGFEKSLKSGITNPNLNLSMRNATIKSDHLNLQSIAKNSGLSETQRILANKSLNQQPGNGILHGLAKLQNGFLPFKSTVDTSQNLEKSQSLLDAANFMRDVGLGDNSDKKGHKTDQEMAGEQDSEEEIELEQRRVDRLFGKEEVERVLNINEIDLYEEFLEPSETRFSKTNIFVNYKEFHNRRNLVEVNRQYDKKHFRKQIRIVNKDKQIDKKMPCWASDLNLVRKVQNIQNKLIDTGLLQDHLNFETADEKREFLRPKVEQLCSLMDREYEINYAKLKKQREEQRRKQLQMTNKTGLSPHLAPTNHNTQQHGQVKQSRAAMLAQGYNFTNPKGQQLVHNLNMHQRIANQVGNPNLLGGHN